MSFLKAEWRKLAIANYEIEPSRLASHLPFGTELDFWEGKCYLSLVGFMFLNTKLLGFKIPFHINFEEVNLRFYVKRMENRQVKRGVVFIKEIVPKPALTFVASENYETMPMKHKWSENELTRTVSYSWKKGAIWHRFQVDTRQEPRPIEPDSKTEFITEHYWGYAKVSRKKTNEYEVKHPVWKAYEVLHHEISIDFRTVYGAEFSFLNDLKPASVMLAEGSEISVGHKRVIEKN